LKRAWMRFWASVSLGLLAMNAIGVAARGPVQSKSYSRHNETILARISPGRTSMARALTLWRNPAKNDEQNHSATWQSCDGDALNVNFSDEGLIQSVWLSKMKARPLRACANAVAMAPKLSTGMGLRLGDAATRVLQLYGEPDSRSPSTKDQQRLELLYYAFDWAGPDVPQMMEVLCTVEKDGKPGRVIEITLSASSL
jgi:hypothetical protein